VANIKFTDDTWERAREYLEAGLTLSQIQQKTGIDKAAISRKAKEENWVKNNSQKQQLIVDAVRVAEAKSTLNQQALSVHDEIVGYQLRVSGLANTFVERSIRKSIQMLKTVDDAASMKQLADTVDRNTITAGINERHAKPNTNNFGVAVGDTLRQPAKIIINGRKSD
jgi:uncharacterized protein YerC